MTRAILRFWRGGLILSFVAGLVLRAEGADGPAGSPQPADAVTKPEGDDAGSSDDAPLIVAAAPGIEHPLAPAIRIAQGALTRLQAVTDYETTLVKSERIGGKRGQKFRDEFVRRRGRLSVPEPEPLRGEGHPGHARLGLNESELVPGLPQRGQKKPAEDQLGFLLDCLGGVSEGAEIHGTVRGAGLRRRHGPPPGPQQVQPVLLREAVRPPPAAPI